jgi:hypothetical protein
VPPRDNRIHSVHDRSGGGRRHRDDCRRGRDVFPMLPVAVTVRSYLVFQMAEVAVPTRAVRLHPRPDRTAASAGPGSMLRLEGCNGGQPGVEVRPECVRGVLTSSRNAPARSPEPVASRRAGASPGAESPCLRGHEGSIRAPRRGWAPSIGEMFDYDSRPLAR